MGEKTEPTLYQPAREVPLHDPTLSSMAEVRPVLTLPTQACHSNGTFILVTGDHQCNHFGLSQDGQ